MGILAEQLMEECGAKNAYVLSMLGDDYTVGLAKNFVSAFEAAGGTVVGNETFTEGTADFSAYLNNAVSGGADVIFCPSATTYAAQIIKQAASLGVTLPILAGDTWENSAISDAQKGTDLKVYCSTFFDENDDSGTAKEFVAGYKAWLNADKQNLTNNGGNDVVAAVSALGYDAYMKKLYAGGERGQYAKVVSHTPDYITKLGIARTFQNIRLFKSMTVFDNVLTAMHVRRTSNLFSATFRANWKEEAQMREKTLELLKIVGLEEFKDELATSLPYGKQRRLEIARALATQPSLLLLDEPAAGMISSLRFIGYLRIDFYSVYQHLKSPSRKALNPFLWPLCSQFALFAGNSAIFPIDERRPGGVGYRKPNKAIQNRGAIARSMPRCSRFSQNRCRGGKGPLPKETRARVSWACGEYPSDCRVCGELLNWC